MSRVLHVLEGGDSNLAYTTSPLSIDSFNTLPTKDPTMDDCWYLEKYSVTSVSTHLYPNWSERSLLAWSTQKKSPTQPKEFFDVELVPPTSTKGSLNLSMNTNLKKSIHKEGTTNLKERQIICN